jgi:DNA-directed RNA polymerase subunit RPC12/RpoP
MTNSTSDEDLYFWGMFKNKWDNRFKKEKIIACSQCGSKRIHKVTLQEPVFIKLDIPFKCEDCGYQGKPREFDSEKEYEKFINKLK